MPSTKSREKVVGFRVSPRERRELALLARAEGKTKSELLRDLVRERAEETAGVTTNGDGTES